MKNSLSNWDKNWSYGKRCILKETCRIQFIHYKVVLGIKLKDWKRKSPNKFDVKIKYP